MKIKIAIGFVLAIIFVTNVSESNARTSGTELLQYCTDTMNHFQKDQKVDMVNVGLCLGQVEGVLWTLHGLKKFMPEGAQFCVPQISVKHKR